MSQDPTRPEAPIQPRNSMALQAMFFGLSAGALWWLMAVGYFGAEPMCCAVVALPLTLTGAIGGVIGLLRPGRKWMALVGLFGCALTVPIIFGWVQFDVPSLVTASRIAATKSQLDELSKSLNAFHTDAGRYPTSGEGLAALVKSPSATPQWHGPYVISSQESSWDLDAWGNPIIYTCPGARHPEGFDLSSNGLDGEPNTPDDIISP